MEIWVNPFTHTSPFGRIHFELEGLLGGKFQFHSNLKKVYSVNNSEEPDQTPRSAASDLVLHYLFMSLKRTKMGLYLPGPQVGGGGGYSDICIHT